MKSYDELVGDIGDAGDVDDLEIDFIDAAQLLGIFDIDSNNFNGDSEVDKKNFLSAWNKIFDLKFSEISPYFLNWIKNISIDDNKYLDGFNKDQFELWKAILIYLNSNIDEKKLVLESIKSKLEEYTKDDKDPSGMGLLPSFLSTSSIIRNVYLSEDKELIEIFSSLQKPSSQDFVEGDVPKNVFDDEQKISSDVLKFAKPRTVIVSVNKRVHFSFAKLSGIVVRLQRIIRYQKRKEEMRILIKSFFDKINQSKTDEEIERFIEDANNPYKPKCNPQLADRLLNVSKKVKPFDKIRHLTSLEAATDILNNGFFGRKTLMRFRKKFRPAALGYYDRVNGDADVICFGSENGGIDDKAMQSDTLEFVCGLESVKNNLSKLGAGACFFKQKDLGYELKKTRKVKIGSKTILFDHTEGNSDSGYFLVKFFDGNEGNEVENVRLINFQMISSNLEEMNSILTMNFFRFLDSVESESGKIFAKQIYSELEKMSDDEIQNTLSEIALNASDTMEFNFFGSYLMDPESIEVINVYREKNVISCSLNVKEFISDIQKGNVEKLLEVQNNIPQLFKSYRFLDYLLSKTKNEEILKILSNDRKKCDIPSWRTKIEQKRSKCTESLTKK